VTLTAFVENLADRIEAAAGSPLGILAFFLWCGLMPEINVDLANYGISVFTAALLVLTIGAARRDRKAVHVKLDDLEDAIEEADSENVRLEERTEKEIEEARLK